MCENDIKEKAATVFNQAAPVKPRLVNPFHFQAGKHHPLKTVFITLLALVIAGTAYGAYSFPRGKITSPTAGTKTARIVEIEGYTKRIPPDRRYVWVVVELPDRGLCWPKRPIYKPNGTSKTTILEKGPNKKFTVSLYAVDKACNDEILHWLDVSRKSGRESGLNIVPKEFRLDSVNLKLQEI